MLGRIHDGTWERSEVPARCLTEGPKTAIRSTFPSQDTLKMKGGIGLPCRLPLRQGTEVPKTAKGKCNKNDDADGG